MTLAPTPGDLPEGVLPSDHPRPDGTVVHSLTLHAFCAMDRHKWIESEKQSCDAGDAALHDWIDRYWKGWTRARLIEHLYGWRCWGAFDEDDFGLLARRSVEHHVPSDVLALVGLILAEGGENLDVIQWALGEGRPLDPILWLLDRIDINAKRQALLAEHVRQFLPERKP